MRIYIKRENCNEGEWMYLPADHEIIARTYRKLEDMHPSRMVPYLGAVESTIEDLADHLGDSTIFYDRHMELFNELANTIDGWDEDERVRFSAALCMENPCDIESVTELSRHLDFYVLDKNLRNWKQAGHLALKKLGIQVEKDMESCLDLERIGKDYINKTGHMTQLGYVTKAGPNNDAVRKEYPCETDKEYLLNVYVTCDNGHKKGFHLPLSELERNDPAIKEMANRTEIDTVGYLRELPCFLPPGLTFWELDQVAEDISQLSRAGTIQKEKLFAILEAGLPGTIEKACQIIQRYHHCELICGSEMDCECLTELAMNHYGRSVPDRLKKYFKREEFLQTYSMDQFMAQTSYGYVYHPEEGLIQPLNENKRICLYCPLTVCIYWDDQDSFSPDVLEEERVIKLKSMIEEAVRGYQQPEQNNLGEYVYNQLLRRKIAQMVPEVDVYEGQLWGVLEVRLCGLLTEAEEKELCSDWKRQAREGWGKELLEHPFRIAGGEMHIGYWDNDYGKGLCIRTETELKGDRTSLIEMY